MKKLFLSLCLAMFTMAASAQVTWNAKGGVGLATCYGDVEGMKTHFVGKIGGGLEYALSSNFSLMPSLELAWKGAKFGEGSYKETLDIFYIQVPVVAAYRLNLTDSWNMTVKAGPYVAFNAYDKVSWEEGDKDKGSEDANLNKVDAGLDVGIDFEHHKFVFGLEAEMGFIELVDESKVKNLAFYATIGWKF